MGSVSSMAVDKLEDEGFFLEEFQMDHQHKIDIKKLIKLVKSNARGYINEKDFRTKLSQVQDEEVVRIVEALSQGPDEFGAYIVRKKDGSIDYAFKFVINPNTYELAFGRKPHNLSVSGYYTVEINQEKVPLMCRVFIFDEKRHQKFGGVKYFKIHKAEYFTVVEGRVRVVKAETSELKLRREV